MMMKSKIVFAMVMAIMVGVEGKKLGLSVRGVEQQQQQDAGIAEEEPFTASVLRRESADTDEEINAITRRLKKSNSKKSGKGSVSGPTPAPSVSLMPSRAPSGAPSGAPSISMAPSRAPSGAPSGAPSISMAPSLSQAPSECGKGSCDNVMSSSKRRRRELRPSKSSA